MKPFLYHENPADESAFAYPSDAWAIDHDRGIYVVADAPRRHLVRDSKPYPYEDYGHLAANTFCKEFLESATTLLAQHGTAFSTEHFKEVLVSANRAMRRLNDTLGKRYDDRLNYDVAECVGMGAVRVGNTLFYGGLEDCYVNILRGEKYESVHTMNYQIKKAQQHMVDMTESREIENHIPKELEGKLDKDSRWEPCWCNYLRNNIEVKNSAGEPAGWGCFTGEERAEQFFQIHSTTLQSGDTILLCSNGMIPALSDEGFVKWLFQNAKPEFHFHREVRKTIKNLLGDEEKRDSEKTMISFQYIA